MKQLNNRTMFFKKVSSRPDFPKMEREKLDYWEKNKIFEKSLRRPAPRGNFVFYEGPPTANGKPGVHHLEARAFKDLFPRYKTMRGYKVLRKAGWDTHGLPVELEVEKNLGFSGKKDIEAYGIEKFNKKCAESVWRYKSEWEELTRRVGFWLDLKHPYITCDNQYMESVWWIIKQIWKGGLLYQGHKVVPYCPRCGTALSSHEVAQGYRKISEESVFVKFKIRTPLHLPLERGEQLLLPGRGRREGVGVHFLAWTTTPWTLPGNVALALGADIDYVLVGKVSQKDNKTPLKSPLIRGEGEYFILAKKRLEVLDGDYKIIKRFKGKDLVGIEYEPLYPIFNPGENSKVYHTVLADFVTTEEGTGIVHTAVMYGEDDYELGKKLDLPQKHTVDEQGKFDFNFLENEREDSSPDKGRKATPAMQALLARRCGRGRVECKFKVQSSKLKVENPLTPLIKGEQGIQGRFVKDAEKDIIEDLRRRGLLYKSELYTHDYPFCWRCKTPLLYYAKKSWFIAMSKLREKLVANNQKINWIPKYLKTGRFGKWIAEARDWAVSRERYWGTPMPIWQCQTGKGQKSNRKSQKFRGCGEMRVIGSMEELREANSSPDKGRKGGVGCKFKVQSSKLKVETPLNPPCQGGAELDLHRPYIDEITFKCQKCGGEMRRVPEVLDCWFDSGAMPFAQNHWPFDSSPDKGRRGGVLDRDVKTPLISPLIRGEKNPPEQFPADFICEAVDQTRGWFYTLLAISTLLDFGAPYKNVISLGHVLDEKGQKMSKSRGNIVEPFRALDNFGADALRWFFYTVNRPQASKNFDPEALREIISRLILTLWNSYSFFLTYASIDQPKVGVDPCVEPRGGQGNILDQWILSRLAELNKNIVHYLNHYNVLNAGYAIEKFVDDLSNWYIRRSRRRFWKSESDADKNNAYQTLYFVLLSLSKILAPFMPFLSEEIYRGLTSKESVHLEDFPRLKEDFIDLALNEGMEECRRIVNLGLGLRAQGKLRVRQPLSKFKMQKSKCKMTMQNAKLLDIIKEELNVKEIEFKAKIEEGKDWLIGEEKGLKVALNIEITPELKREGFARDLVRVIQEMRKKAGLEVSDRIELSLESEDKDIQKAIAEWQDYIKKETLAERLEDIQGKADGGEKVRIEGKEVEVKVKKIKK